MATEASSSFKVTRFGVLSSGTAVVGIKSPDPTICLSCSTQLPNADQLGITCPLKNKTRTLTIPSGLPNITELACGINAGLINELALKIAETRTSLKLQETTCRETHPNRQGYVPSIAAEQFHDFLYTRNEKPKTGIKDKVVSLVGEIIPGPGFACAYCDGSNDWCLRVDPYENKRKFILDILKNGKPLLKDSADRQQLRCGLALVKVFNLFYPEISVPYYIPPSRQTYGNGRYTLNE